MKQDAIEKFCRFLRTTGMPFWRLEVVTRDGGRQTRGKYPAIAEKSTRAASADDEGKSLSKAELAAHIDESAEQLKDICDFIEFEPGTRVYLYCRNSATTKTSGEVSCEFVVPRGANTPATEQQPTQGGLSGIGLGYIQSREERLEDARRDFIRWEDDKRELLRAERLKLEEKDADLRALQRMLDADKEILAKKMAEVDKDKEYFGKAKNAHKEGFQDAIGSVAPDLLKEFSSWWRGGAAPKALSGADSDEPQTEYEQLLDAYGVWVNTNYPDMDTLKRLIQFTDRFHKETNKPADQ